MIDTHCHLNFEAFEGTVDQTLANATAAGITHLVVPGTDIPSSTSAIRIADMYDNVFAAVGIHPHHAYEIQDDRNMVPQLLKHLDELLEHSKVTAVGEIGLDRHVYKNTQYDGYQLSDSFLEIQQRLFTHQLYLAAFIQKPVITHNRDAADWLLEILEKYWDEWFSGKLVFHCCEANEQLLTFAKERHIYIGVDGDVTYSKKKAAFVQQVPLELLVLETDSPYLTPEPTRQTKKFPNEPANLVHTARYIANLKGISLEELNEVTTTNAKQLFGLPT